MEKSAGWTDLKAEDGYLNVTEEFWMTTFPSSKDSQILLPHHCHHPRYSFYQRQAQSLQHVQFPHLDCCSPLWIFSTHIPSTINSQLHGSRESAIYILYHYCTHADPPDLQSLE